ncbi:unnamed protein product, partial [Nesidiocoris tenuis]
MFLCRVAKWKTAANGWSSGRHLIRFSRFRLRRSHPSSKCRPPISAIAVTTYATGQEPRKPEYSLSNLPHQ